MSAHIIEFQISDLATWTTVSDLPRLIKSKRDGVYLALAWGDQDVVNGYVPPYQAGFEKLIDLKRAPRAFGLSVSYPVGGILARQTAFFAATKSSPKTVQFIGLERSVDLGERNWVHYVREVYDLRNGTTRAEKDTLGLGKLGLSHIKIASTMRDILCKEMQKLAHEILDPTICRDSHSILTSSIHQIASNHEDPNVRQLFAVAAKKLAAANTSEQFTLAANQIGAAISAFRDDGYKKFCEELAKARLDMQPTTEDISRLRDIFPISLKDTVLTAEIPQIICEQIASVRRVARLEFALQKPVQFGYMSTGFVHDPEMASVADLVLYASHAKERGIEGADAAVALASTVVRALTSLTPR